MQISRLSALVSIAVMAALATGLPGVADAQSMPSRKAMVQRQPGLWIDATAGAAQVKAIQARIAAAGGRVAGALGATAAPEWWICTSQDCDRQNDFRARGMTYGATLITLNAAGSKDDAAYVHELAHATMHAALPMGGVFSRALPLWFDEGVAVLVSGEPPQAADPKICANPPQVKLPQNARQFSAHVGGSSKKALPVYQASACAVRGWLAQGNKLSDVLPALRQGRKLP